MKKTIIFLLSLAASFGSFAQYKLTLKTNIGWNTAIPNSDKGNLGYFVPFYDIGANYKESKWGAGIEYSRGSEVLESAGKFAKLEIQGSYNFMSNLDARLGYISYENTLAHLFYTAILPNGTLAGFEVNDLAIDFLNRKIGSVTGVTYKSRGISLGMQYSANEILKNDDRLLIYADLILPVQVNYFDRSPHSSDDPNFDPNVAGKNFEIKKSLGYRVGANFIGDLSEHISYNFGTEFGVLAPAPQIYWSLTFGLSLNFIE